MNRVTSYSASTLMLSNLYTSQRALATSQQQMASGKKIQKASDGPAEAVASLDTRAKLRRSTQLDRSAGRAKEWLQASDGATQSIVDGINQARSLLVQANSGTLDNTARTSIANQLIQIRESLLGTANTAVLGRPIFSGTAAGSAAYDTTGAFVGDTTGVSLPIASGVTIRVSRTGPEVFGMANATDPANGDLFQQLSSMATSVAANDTAAIANGLNSLDAAATRVAGIQVELGSKLNQIDDLRSAAQAQDTELTSFQSSLEDIDYAELSVKLKTQEASYQAALQVTARVIQPSLLDFLK